MSKKTFSNWTLGRIYTEKRYVSNDSFRTYLSVLSANICSHRHFSTTTDLRRELYQQQFAKTFQGYTHLSVEDMTLSWKSEEKGLNPELNSTQKTCSRQILFLTGIFKNKKHEKDFFSVLLSDFNGHVHLDHFYIRFLTPRPITHVVDNKSAYFETAIIPTRSIDTACRYLEMIWINKNGTPAKVPADPEFASPVLLSALEYVGTEFYFSPACWRTKIGSVKPEEAAVKDFRRRLKHDAKFSSERS